MLLAHLLLPRQSEGEGRQEGELGHGRETVDAIILAEQALRLAALFHDLGHLPFSHDFEFALESVHSRLSAQEGAESRLVKQISLLRAADEEGKSAKQIHEKVGQRVSELLLRDIGRSTPSRDSRYDHAVFRLAREIIDASKVSRGWQPESDAARAKVWLHDLIDGEIDVDRSDYLLRDGRQYGFDFAIYSLERLLRFLVVERSDQTEHYTFVSAIEVHGIDAAESFLASRARSYQFGVRHHKVTQVGTGLRFCIEQILLDERGTPLHELVATIAEIVEDSDTRSSQRTTPDEELRLLRLFSQYDDIWLTSWLRSKLLAWPMHPPSKQQLQVFTEDREAALEFDRQQWLALVLRRERGPSSLWKRRDVFESLIAPHGLDLRQALIASRPGKEGSPDSNKAEVEAMTLVQVWNELMRKVDLGRWQDSVETLRQNGVLVVTHRFNPTKGLSVRTHDGTLKEIGEFSPQVRMLPSAWMDDVQVHAFATPRSCYFGAPEKVIESLAETLTWRETT